jgi:hypothetical protein
VPDSVKERWVQCIKNTRKERLTLLLHSFHFLFHHKKGWDCKLEDPFCRALLLGYEDPLITIAPFEEVGTDGIPRRKLPRLA